MSTDQAIFAAGCFWGVQHFFDAIEGVTKTTVGYAGGTTENPSYRDVCSHNTNHAECIDIRFDPDVISYEKLLDHFWQCHNPTSINKQGPDVGSQYRSAIFYCNDAQKNTAANAKKTLNDSDTHSLPIATEITQASTFYAAEDEHQDYFKKHPNAACAFNP
jgi:peptide-methionine (S)-S-oxide reductase